MKIGVIKTIFVIGLMTAAVNCYAYNVYNSSADGGRTEYVTDLELCDDGTLLIKLSFTPENICDSGVPAICNSVAPTWYYVSPNDVSSDNYQRLVTTAATAEANQYIVSFFNSTQNSATFTCNNVTVDAIGEMSVLNIVNHG